MMKMSLDKGNAEKKAPRKGLILIDELYASELRYRCLFESTKDGILILDAETGKIVDVNPFLIDLLGYSKNEFVEKSIWEIGAFQDFYDNREKFIELQQKEYVRYDDLPLVTSSGQRVHVEFISSVYLVSNSKVIQCNIRDITARKETEAALEKTREELAEIKKTTDEINKFTENIIDTVREPLLAIDKDLRVIKASRSFYHFFKVIPDETIGKLIYELGNHQWDIPKLKELLERIIPEKNSFDNYEVEHNFSTIGKRVMLLNARQIKRAFGKEKVILLAIEDITERKGKEDSLNKTYRATSDSLNILLDLMHMPIIIWDTSMIIKRFNRHFELLSGYDSAEVIDRKIDFLFPKEKISATLELLKNHLDDKLDVVEVDILTKDNQIRTVLWNSSPILDEEGKNIIATISQDITTRRQSELALRKSESHLRTLVKTIPDLIWLKDTSGVYLSCNPMFERFFGAKEADIIGKTDYDFVDREFADFFRVNDRKAVEAGKPTNNEEWVTFADDGHRAFLDTIKSPIYDSNGKLLGILGIGRNITERKKSEDALLESEIKYRAFFENSMDAILLTNPNGEIQSANQAACNMFGYSEDELIKLGRSAIVDSSDSRLPALLVERKLKGKARGEVTLLRKERTPFPAEISSAIFKNQAGFERTSMIIRDITERKRTEMELLEAKESAEESDRLKTAFLHNISHEIRTPMNAIVGFSGFLDDPDLLPEKRKHYVDIIIKSSDQLLAIIDDIIIIASIEAGREKIQESEININLICKLIDEQFYTKNKLKNVTLGLKTGLADDEAMIISDPTKLTQILTNLVGNALKFTQQGHVNFGYRVMGNQLEFYVEDSGVGIPMDMQEKIFNRFRQVETTDKRNFGGSGLGLSISKAYVEMLGGKMWLTSELGKGSVFYFTIPYKHTNPDNTHDIQFSNGLKFDFSTTKELLIAEDEDSNFMLLEVILADSGINITRAVNGLEAVQRCKSNPQIDLVLMDIKMPEMDGYEATTRIKEFRPNLPIIAQTAYITEADRRKALACGCSDFLTKPINKKLLLSKIYEQLHK